MIIKKDLSGYKFNKLSVIEPIKRETGERTKYKCVCDCGNEIIVEGSKIKNGHTKSCGCIKKEIFHGYNKLPEGEASRNSLISSYKNNAKLKGIKFDLTKDDLINFFESNCYYCGREPYMVTYKKGTNGGYIYTGIDRKDNNKDIGYTIENTVACCTKCNYIKNKLDFDEFISWIKEVNENLKNNGII